MTIRSTKKLSGNLPGLLMLFALLASGAVAQPLAEPSSQDEAEQLRRLPPVANVAPLTARFILNGETLDYASKGSLSFGVNGGEHRNTTGIGRATFGFANTLHEGEAGGIYSRHQKGWYLQFGLMDSKRRVTVTQKQAVDLKGFKLKLSVTGSCIMPDVQSDELCTFTPGLATGHNGTDPNAPGYYDPNYYDPDTLLPTQLIETGQAGDEISQDTSDALKVMVNGGHVWQRGVEGGDEIVGVDFDIPNAGAIASESRAGENGIGRKEKVWSRGVLTLSRVEQNLYSNGDQAALDRTVRGFVLLKNDEWNRKSVAIQALAWVLPGADSKLPPKGQPGLDINNNLFYAANNQWVPKDSYTAFQTGKGYAAHMKTPPRNAWETTPGWYHGIWMGFSPVRRIEAGAPRSWTRTTGKQIITHGPHYAEGGPDTGLEFPDSAITIIDDIQQQITNIELSNINNLWVQTGLELTSQAALSYVSTTETSYYSLVPHVAVAGNRTDAASVFRYYAGVIMGDERNAYIGSDYTAITQNGFRLNARAEAYSRPDRDYYSFAELGLMKVNRLENGNRFSFGFGARKSFDRPNGIVDKFDSLSRDTMLDLLARYETTNGLSYDLRQRFTKDNDKRRSSTTIGFSYNASDRFSFNGQITPISNESSYIRARAGFSWRVADNPNAGVLQVQWADIKYDYGADSVGQALKTNEQTLLASFQMRF